MTVARALVGVLVAWPLVGMMVGTAAAIWRRFPVGVGIIAGFFVGPFAYRLFFEAAEQTRAERQRMRKDALQLSPYPARRCPDCAEPNTSLVWKRSTSRTVGGPYGDFVPSQREVFTHRYECSVCGYSSEFDSPHVDPDKPPIREY